MAYNWSPDGVRLINSLYLEYKAPKWAERPASWARAKVQLTNYITALHAVPQGVGGIYGAVAIGLWIRFYRSDRNTQSLTPLVTGDPRYHVVRECQNVEACVAHIEANHLR